MRSQQVFCYYCVASEHLENPKAPNEVFVCLREALACPHCGDGIESMTCWAQKSASEIQLRHL